MEKLTFYGLQPDIFFSQPWFEEFVTVYADVINELIRDPISQLQSIRDISNIKDPWVASQTLKQIGFDLPIDFIRHNMDKLKSALSQLVLYAERSGTSDYADQLQFIFGRSVDVVELYTNNYKDYYERPYGPLLIDGGEWYKTTHIDLGMQALPTDSLVIPRGKLRRDRYIDAFYELAPWNVVVENFYYNIDMQLDTYFSGVLFRHPKRYIEFGAGAYVEENLTIDCVSEIYEQGKANVSVTVLRGAVGDGTSVVNSTVEVDATLSSSRPGLITFVGNRMEVGNVNNNTPVTIFATYKGNTVSKDITVLNSDVYDSIKIDGPVVARTSNTETFTVLTERRGRFETSSIEVRTATPNVTVANGTVDFSLLTEDTTVYLEASTIVGNVELSTVHAVQVKYITHEVQLDSLSLGMVDEVFENSQLNITAMANYTDGYSRNVLCSYSSDSDILNILPDGTVYVGMVEDDVEVTITARYQDKVDVENTKKLLVKSRTNTIKSIHIQGPNTVYGQSKTQYALVATFSDGSQAYVHCDWVCSQYSISEDGVLDAGYVTEERDSLTIIKASVDGLSTSMEVLVVATPVVLNSISVNGTDILNEGSSAKFTSFAQYSNGRQVSIRPSWSIVGNYPWITVDNNGMVSFSNPKEGIVEVQAVYNHNGKRYTQSKPLVLVPKTKIIVGLLISGPTTVSEAKRIALTATAVYSDGTSEIVSPYWEVFPADPLNDEEPMADITSPGVLQGRYVEEETDVIAIARYYSGVAEFKVTVLPFIEPSPDIPIASRIIGTATFTSDTRASFAHMITFEESGEIAVSSDWSIDAPPDVAQIDENGILWSVNGKNTVVTVTSTYVCRDQTVIDSVVVHIMSSMEPELQAIRIWGDAFISDVEPHKYIAELFYKGQDIRENAGRVVDAEWSVINSEHSSKVVINPDGRLFVVDDSDLFSVTLQATFTENFETVTDTKVIQFIPAAAELKSEFGVGPIGIDTGEELAANPLTQIPNLVSGFEFTIVSNLGQFGYFCHPVSMGIATFTDTTSSFVGGWDGASWPDDGNIGTVYGPIVIQRKDENNNISDWYLYRTDFDGNGEQTFQITFP